MYAHVRGSGACPAGEYLDRLDERQRKRIGAILRRTADHGPPKNPELCAPLAGEDFLEFKAHRVRIFWRYARDRRIVLFHGFTKKSRRTPKNELAIGRRRSREAAAGLDL